ncbi:MAG: site-specific integrase [Chloroflexota bacterium]|nr:site-specific integrase [Chloroflexota bacterium]
MPRVSRGRDNKKRSNGEGTITRRKDGRWQAALYKPDGDRKFYYGATREEVHDKLIQAQDALLQGLPLPDERVTVGEFLDHWLETLRNLGSVRRSTWDSYESYVRIHLKPGLGKLSLAKLQPAQLQQFMSKQVNAGVSPRSVRYSRVVLRAAIGQAMKEGFIVRNVVALTTPPKAAPRNVAKPLTPEEALRLVNGLEGDRLKALHILTLGLGLRQGEALGLRWADVDLEAGVCHIRTELTRLEGEYRLEELKTEKSRRDLPLDGYLVGILRERRKHQNEDRLSAKRWENEWDLVFTTSTGRPLHFAVVTHQFQEVLGRLGIEKRRHYDLRHSAASLMIDRGAELRDVMEQLGHSQIALTANTYGHIYLERKKKLAASMGTFLSSATKATGR